MSTSILPFKEENAESSSIFAVKCTTSWFPSRVSYWPAGNPGPTAFGVRDKEVWREGDAEGGNEREKTKYNEGREAERERGASI